MTWSIPAKTFLLGEYIALLGGPAILLTTQPCFQMKLIEKEGLHGIHIDSPAGRFWAQHNHSLAGLQWDDPYQACGGLGASSAQFLGAHYAHQKITQKTHTLQKILNDYMQCSWSGQGMQPSGYDVIAQSMSGCVYINQKKIEPHSYTWCFNDVGFILIHTGHKLATHHHLQTLPSHHTFHTLTSLVNSAQKAFETQDATRLIEAINSYHHALLHMDLVAPHTRKAINILQQDPQVLAVKGCGAMGSDLLCLITSIHDVALISQRYKDTFGATVATQKDLHTKKS